MSYNHKSTNVYEACSIDEQEFKRKTQQYEILKFFPVFTARELAFMLCNDLNGMFLEDNNIRMAFSRPHTKLEMFNLNRTPKEYDIDILVEDMQAISEDIRINKFASWHMWIIASYALIDKRSMAVQFVEENYSKSEIFVLFLFKHAQKAVAAQKVKDTDDVSKMIKMLKSIANDEIILYPIPFTGDVKKDEEYDILSIEDDFTDRMIVQNDPTHKLIYANANSVAQIYGVSHESVKSLVAEKENMKEYLEAIANLKLTDVEEAVFFSAGIDKLTIETICCKIPATMPSLISYYQCMKRNKRSHWTDEVFAYDSIERVQWLLNNNATVEDMERIARIFQPECEK